MSNLNPCNLRTLSSSGLLYVVLFTLSAALWAKSGALKKVRYMTHREQEILAELNLARQQPGKYAAFLKKRRKYYRKDNIYHPPGRDGLITKEGVSAVNEAIAFLEKAKPIGPLSPSAGLTFAAKDHAEDIGDAGMVGHTGSDGNSITDRTDRHGKWKVTCGENVACGLDSARDVVLQLIVDDDVPDRGHRTNIYNAAFKTVGISIRRHKQYRHVCVMDFAGAFVDNAASKKLAGKRVR